MARKDQTEEMIDGEQESTEEMEMLLSLVHTGECIGEIDYAGKCYQLWDYKTSQHIKRPADILVGIWMCGGKYSYFFVKRSMLIRLN